MRLTKIKKTTTAFSKGNLIKNFINSSYNLEVPEGFEPSTFSSVARRSNPIELWDRRLKIPKKIARIKEFIFIDIT
tara:strand:- start:46 stop:273 length:228 start_codon:yes stop_codon:yes gene_type:complete